MKLEMTLVLPDGSEHVREIEALPLHDRPCVPPGTTIILASDDLERLQTAVERLRRASVAQSAIGNFELTFSAEAGLQANSEVPDLPLKALALEARPFFLNDDPLFFPALVRLRSFAQVPALAREFRQHTKRWKMSGFNGEMQITAGAHALDVENVISAWFNSDYFHTGPQKPEELSLEGLKKSLGGESAAKALLATHLTSSLGVFWDVVASRHDKTWQPNACAEGSATPCVQER